MGTGAIFSAGDSALVATSGVASPQADAMQIAASVNPFAHR